MESAGATSPTEGDGFPKTNGIDVYLMESVEAGVRVEMISE